MKSILEVHKVSVRSGKIPTGPDSVASRFLEAMGFGRLRCLTNRMEAERLGSNAYLLEFDSSIRANRRPFRLISVRGDEWRLVDYGMTTHPPDEKGGRVELAGNTMADWHTFCDPANARLIEAHRLKMLKNEILPQKVVDLTVPEHNLYDLSKPAPTVRQISQASAVPPEPEASPSHVGTLVADCLIATVEDARTLRKLSIEEWKKFAVYNMIQGKKINLRASLDEIEQSIAAIRQLFKDDSRIKVMPKPQAARETVLAA
jgi:hypothetical protein